VSFVFSFFLHSLFAILVISLSHRKCSFEIVRIKRIASIL